MIRVGITGGIGSGKSTVAGILEGLGAPVYYTDVAAKRIVNGGEAVREAIISEFGELAYSADGTYNRKYMSQVIFGDRSKLARINAIVHPAVAADAAAWNQANEQRGAPVAYHESALILETGSIGSFHRLLVVHCSSIQERLRRIVARDSCTKEEALARIAAQTTDEERLFQADYSIDNLDGDLAKEVRKVHEHLLGLFEIGDVQLRALRPRGGSPAVL
jgi:dephospho-CoA kinase